MWIITGVIISNSIICFGMIGEAITGSHLIGQSNRPQALLSTVLSAASWLGVTPVINHTMCFPQGIIAYGQPSPQWPRSSDSTVQISQSWNACTAAASLLL